jgi:2,6-dihydroxypseudooxynicotine hydrolase
LTDYEAVAQKIENWDDWCRMWGARAEIHETAGREALTAGNTISAALHLVAASVTYHFAKFVFVNDMAQLKATHDKAVECRNLALPHLDPPGERVEIPYENGHLYGILRKPRGIDNPPVVILCMGMDSAKEEMSTNEAHFHQRGLATLTFDGPGQGEGEYDFAICPEYEKPVSAVVDYIETRNDLDAARIGIWGVSFGGYYAPRAAAYEKRIKACISISGPFEFFNLIQQRGSHEVFVKRAHCETDEEALEVAKRVEMADAAKLITCPLFIVGGELDTLTPPDHQEKLAAEASGPTELLILKGGNHCANNLRHLYSPQTADWMAGHLGGHVG